MSIPVSVNWDFSNFDFLEGRYGQTSPDGIYYGSVQNVSTVLIADSSADVGSTLVGSQATDDASVTIYGRQAAGALVTILASASDAQTLSTYLQRGFPSYWFSDLEVQLNRLNATQRTTIANLEIGDQLRVSKLFPNMASPTVQELFVEGIEHRITQNSHVVTIYTSPTDLVLAFILDTSTLDDATYGLG